MALRNSNPAQFLKLYLLEVDSTKLFDGFPPLLNIASRMILWISSDR